MTTSTSAAFTQLAVKTNPAAFGTVPVRAVRDIGLFTHRSVKLDLAVLSAFAYHHHIANLPDRSWAKRVLQSERIQRDPHLPEILTLAQGEFWISRKRIGENLMARWHFADVSEDRHDGTFGEPEYQMGFGPRNQKPLAYPNVERFHKNVRNAATRLEKSGYVKALRTVQFEKQKVGSMGSVFTPDGVPNRIDPDRVVPLPSPASLLIHPHGPEAALTALTEGHPSGEHIPVVDLVGAAYLAFDAFLRAGDE